MYVASRMQFVFCLIILFFFSGALGVKSPYGEIDVKTLKDGVRTLEKHVAELVDSDRKRRRLCLKGVE